MHNQFRTILLNLPYDGNANEHIPASFGGLVLPRPLNNIHQLLFPSNTSRYYKLFLVNNYLQIIASAGLQTAITDVDDRITYSLDNTDYFKIHRNSNPTVSDIRYPIFIYGNYSVNSKNNYFYDNFLISQVEDTPYITIYSTVNKYYLMGGAKFDSPDDAEIEVPIGAGGITPLIPIGDTNLKIQLGGRDTFIDNANKTWEFLVEAPYIFNLKDLIARIKTNTYSKELFNYRPEINVDKYQAMYEQHFNPIYQLAGYLIAYTLKCNNLL